MPQDSHFVPFHTSHTPLNYDLCLSSSVSPPFSVPQCCREAVASHQRHRIVQHRAANDHHLHLITRRPDTYANGWTWSNSKLSVKNKRPSTGISGTKTLKHTNDIKIGLRSNLTCFWACIIQQLEMVLKTVHMQWIDLQSNKVMSFGPSF